MAKELTVHNIYMRLTFRPMIRADGSMGRVGVQVDSPMCIDPEIYPNLITAAPAMYQMLTVLKDNLNQKDVQVIENIETILAFAQNGYLSGPSVDSIIKGLRK